MTRYKRPRNCAAQYICYRRVLADSAPAAIKIIPPLAGTRGTLGATKAIKVSAKLGEIKGEG